MSDREFLGVCDDCSARSYLRLSWVDDPATVKGRCPRCGGPATLHPLPPREEN